MNVEAAPFTYPSVRTALRDLAIFSGMNVYENVVLYLVRGNDGYQIVRAHEGRPIVHIALNSIVYKEM